MDHREERGAKIASSMIIRRIGTSWVVPSSSGNGSYEIDIERISGEMRCTCLDFSGGTKKCKHIFAVEMFAIPKSKLRKIISPAPAKRTLGMDVLTAARQRISRVFDDFPRIYVSFSGGKDSGVMVHLVMEEARRRGRKVGMLFVDLEGQYKLTIDYVERTYREYADVVDPYWVALPIHLRNAVSQFEPQWVCWDPDRREDWIRDPHPLSIVDEGSFPFFRRAMEFEEFTPDFGHWYSRGKLTACFVGIRTQESLNRFRTIAHKSKARFENLSWTTWCGEKLYNAYPIYDWTTEDIWTYYGKFGRDYNRLYDRMHQAGLTIHQARICQPYGDDQRKGLWLFHVIEPETWARVVARVNGANQGAMYVRERGNVLGYGKIVKPPDITWEQFARMILASMPPATAEHYSLKINEFIRWWENKRGAYMEDIEDPDLPAGTRRPTWRRVCKALLRNDYWCKGLSFTVTTSGESAYARYKRYMKRRPIPTGGIHGY